MEMYIKENELMGCIMGRGKGMVKASIFVQTVENMLVVGLMINNKDMEFMNLKNNSMKVTGLKDLDMEKENLRLMVKYIMVSGNKEKSTVRVNLTGLMEKNI